MWKDSVRFGIKYGERNTTMKHLSELQTLSTVIYTYELNIFFSVMLISIDWVKQLEQNLESYFTPWIFNGSAVSINLRWKFTLDLMNVYKTTQ